MSEISNQPEHQSELVTSDLVDIAEIEGPEGKLKVTTKWTPELVQQIIEKSKQQHILDATGRDAAERFKDLDSFNAWLERDEHELYGLVNPETEDLGGIIWYGKEPMPVDYEYDDPPSHKFAIRLYEGYQGKKLAMPFMEATFHDFLSHAGASESSGIWLQTDIDNEKAYNLYKKFGYEEIARDDKRVTMIYPI